LDSADSPTQIPGTLQNSTEMHTGTKFPRHMHSTTSMEAD